MGFAEPLAQNSHITRWRGVRVTVRVRVGVGWVYPRRWMRLRACRAAKAMLKEEQGEIGHFGPFKNLPHPVQLLLHGSCL